ncbi:MAG: hypothetical protein QOD71_3176 [Thermoleophilaceae bacterium]|jgi:hypothetical protein|nr:hypothetical protein [Thermoleophilaceae bacterium]
MLRRTVITALLVEPGKESQAMALARSIGGDVRLLTRSEPVTFGGAQIEPPYVPTPRDQQWMPDEVYILGWTLGMWQLGAYYGGRGGAIIGLIAGWLYSRIKLALRD